MAPAAPRAFARALALLCLAWLPVYALQDSLGSAQPIAHTLFSLVFIASALFLLAGGMVLGDAGGGSPSRVATWAKRFAPLLLLMLVRTHLEGLANLLSPLVTLQQLQQMAPWLFCSLPVLAAGLLWRMANQPWQACNSRPPKRPSKARRPEGTDAPCAGCLPRSTRVGHETREGLGRAALPRLGPGARNHATGQQVQVAVVAQLHHPRPACRWRARTRCASPVRIRARHGRCPAGPGAPAAPAW